MEQKSSLIQLKSFELRDGVNISSSFAITNEKISLTFLVKDPLRAALLDKENKENDFKFPLNQVKERRWNLWENTCFEFFIGSLDSSDYLEFNASAYGDWNVFFLTDYRAALTEYKECKLLLSRVEKVNQDYQLNYEFKISIFDQFEVSLSRLIASSTAVIHTSKGVQYFAKEHPEGKADFHNKKYWFKITDAFE